MAQVKPLHIGEEREFDNLSGSEIFTGDTHLEINLIDADSAKEVNIWVERNDASNPPTAYTLSSSDMSNSEFNFVLDSHGESFFIGQIVDGEGNVKNNEVEIEVSPAEHHIILDVGNLKYGKLYKFGKLTQNKSVSGDSDGDDEDLVYAIGDATKYWMENGTTLSSSLEYKVEPATASWVMVLDSEGKEVYVTPNLTTEKRECDIIYTLRFGDNFTPQQVIKLHIVQVNYKDTELQIQVDSSSYEGTDNKADKEIEKMLLPVTVKYFTRETVNPVTWDRLTEFKTLSRVLSGSVENRWEEVEISFDDDTLSSGTELGMDGNEIKFKWVEAVTENRNLVRKNSGNTFGTIVCKIDGINKQKKTAWFVSAIDESTGEEIWSSEDYYTVDGYTCALTFLKTSLRDSADRSFLLTEDDGIIGSVSSIPVDLASILSVNGNTAVIIPYGTENTIEGEYVGFGIADLQSCDGNYTVTYDGDVTIGDIDKIVVNETDVSLPDGEDATLIEDGSEEYKDPSQTYYYTYSGLKDALTINGNFTNSTDTTVKGVITYYPMILNCLHTAEYSHTFDKSLIKEDVLYDNNNQKVYKYSLQTEQIHTTKGMEGHEYGWHETKHVAESGTIHYFIGSYAEGVDKQIPMIDLVLQCNIDLPHNVVWDGPNERTYTLKVLVDSSSPSDCGRVEIFTPSASAVTSATTSGSSVTVRAIPNDGFRFVYWGEQNNHNTTSQVSTSATYNFTMPNRNYTLYGYFEEDAKYWVRVHLDSEKGTDRGMVWIDGVTTVTEKQVGVGNLVTVHADNYDCCMPFIRWAEADKSAVAVNTNKDYEFTMPAHDVDLWASFEDCPCEVSVNTTTENTADYTYRINEPAKREDTEYYFIIKNNTDDILTVYYSSYNTANASFKLNVGEIGEVSMLWSPDWNQWVSRYDITKQ